MYPTRRRGSSRCLRGRRSARSRPATAASPGISCAGIRCPPRIRPARSRPEASSPPSPCCIAPARIPPSGWTRAPHCRRASSTCTSAASTRCFLDWRWEAIPSPEGGLIWRPLGTFREGALARYDGIATYLSRPLQPDLTTFGPDYPHTLTGIPDQASAYRYLIGSLGRPVWDSIAAALQAGLTDSVIAAAVGRMPAAYQALVGERLIRTLRERRDNLPRAVDLMFEQVRGQAEVYGSAGAEAVTVEWPAPDSLSLTHGTRSGALRGERDRARHPLPRRRPGHRAPRR